MIVVRRNSPYDWAKEDWTFTDYLIDAMTMPIFPENTNHWWHPGYDPGYDTLLDSWAFSASPKSYRKNRNRRARVEP